MTQLTDLQRRKYTAAFHAFDHDGDGKLDWTDFVAMAHYVRGAMGWAKDAEAFKLLVEAEREYWKQLSTHAGVGVEGMISEEQFVASLKNIADEITKNGKAPQWCMNLMHSMHRALDLDRDGSVSSAEYAVYLKALGSAADPDEAFSQLDLNGDGKLDIDEMEELYVQFIMSDSEKDPGNWLIAGTF